MSPIVTYRTMRDDGLSIAQIQSICRQILSLADADERNELARLQREVKRMLDMQREKHVEEPWEDAGGVIVIDPTGNTYCESCHQLGCACMVHS